MRTGGVATVSMLVMLIVGTAIGAFVGLLLGHTFQHPILRLLQDWPGRQALSSPAMRSFTDRLASMAETMDQIGFAIGSSNRNVSDTHLFVVCRDGEFYTLPEHVRHRGPWQGQHRGEMKNLPVHYLIDIEMQGYALVRCELAVFKPEV